MKKAIALSIAIASSATLPGISHANTGDSRDTGSSIKTELKQATIFSTAGVVGAIAGGPIGMFVGALGGAYLGEQIKKADHLEAVKLAQQTAEKEATRLNDILVERDQALTQLQQQTFDQLQLQVLFVTASDKLTEQGQEKIQALADFLHKNPQLTVHLHGYADPRGTEDYNEVLSHYRTLTVQQALENNGIDATRISLTAHGANRAKTVYDNADTYALERRVEIEILNQQPAALTMK